MRRQLGKNNIPLVACVFEKESLLLRLMQIKVRGTEVCTVLNLGAIADVSSVLLSHRLFMSLSHSPKNIKVANNDGLSYVSSLLKVPITFGDQVIKLEYLLPENLPFNMTSGVPNFLTMHTNMGSGKQSVRLQIGSE